MKITAYDLDPDGWNGLANKFDLMVLDIMNNADINSKIELEALSTGDVLDDEDTFYATALKTVTLPNDNGGFTNHPKGDRVRIDRDEAIKRFGESQVDTLVNKFNKHKAKVELKEVIQSKDGRFYGAQ